MAGGDQAGGDWTGQTLFDVDGEKIGTIEDTIVVTAADELEWLVVESGVAGARKMFVPANEVRRSGDHISVTHTKERVVGAPAVEDDSAPSEDEKGKLCRYYGLQYGASPEGEAAEGCDDMKDLRPGG